MKIQTRTIGDVTILDCSGEITLGEGTMVLRISVRETLKKGGKKIVLNMEEVSYVDESGIGELVSSFTTVSNNGGQFRLMNPTKKNRELLAVQHLLTVFQTFDNEPAAIASFK